MKKGIACLLVAVCMFTSFLVGWFLGRQASPSPVLVERHTEQTSASASATAAPDGTTAPLTVNINTAGLQELQRLPGIGEVLAQRIIDYREENGPFQTVSELTMVSGIGISKLEELMDYITTGGES